MKENEIMFTRIGDILAEVALELSDACRKHAPIQTAHEAYAVLLEELDEFKSEVWRKRELRSPSMMRVELVQIAAMAVRTIQDLGLYEGEVASQAEGPNCPPENKLSNAFAGWIDSEDAKKYLSRHAPFVHHGLFAAFHAGIKAVRDRVFKAIE